MEWSYGKKRIGSEPPTMVCRARLSAAAVTYTQRTSMGIPNLISDSAKSYLIMPRPLGFFLGRSYHPFPHIAPLHFCSLSSSLLMHPSSSSDHLARRCPWRGQLRNIATSYPPYSCASSTTLTYKTRLSRTAQPSLMQSATTVYIEACSFFRQLATIFILAGTLISFSLPHPRSQTRLSRLCTFHRTNHVFLLLLGRNVGYTSRSSAIAKAASSTC